MVTSPTRLTNRNAMVVKTGQYFLMYTYALLNLSVYIDLNTSCIQAHNQTCKRLPYTHLILQLYLIV